VRRNPAILPRLGRLTLPMSDGQAASVCDIQGPICCVTLQQNSKARSEVLKRRKAPQNENDGGMMRRKAIRYNDFRAELNLGKPAGCVWPAAAAFERLGESIST
jgi:hypothetical protein